MSAPRSLVVTLGFVLLVAAMPPRAEVTDRGVGRAFLTLVAGEEGDMVDAMDLIESTWEPAYLSMALDVMRLIRNPAVSATLLRLIETKVGGEHGYDLGAWQRAMWNAPEARHPRYPAFKGALYGFLDPRFPAYFDAVVEPLIRLDEIVWGGVRQDGIPPLRNPGDARRGRDRIPRRRPYRVRHLGQRRCARLPPNASSAGTRCSSTWWAACRSRACTARSAAP